MFKIRKKEAIRKKNPDYEMLENIQPAGGITTKDEKFISTGNAYISYIHVYEFPKKISDFWMEKLCNISNTIALVDISTDNIIEVKKNLNKSMKEQKVRYETTTNDTEKLDAKRRYQEMEAMYNEIESMGRVVKLVHIRIMVSDRNRYTCEEHCKNIIDSLEADGYRCAVFLNEGKREWLSMFRSYKDQEREEFYVPGQPLLSKQLAVGYPFYFSSLEDKYGTYLGFTSCGGNVIFSPFTKTKTRTYYNSLVVGNMGSGKSTLLKKLFKQSAMLGDYVRVFDITGEFRQLTQEFGGRIIKWGVDGKIINPLEIIKAGETENISYSMTIARLTVLYKCLVSDYKNEEITQYQNTLKELYKEYHLDPSEGNVTGLSAKMYPIFSDYRRFLENKIQKMSQGKYNTIQKKLVEEELIVLSRIKRTVDRIVDSYGYIFDGYTTFDNIVDEQIVTFDISNLKELEPGIFDAQMFNMVSLCWGNCVENGTIMKAKYESGEISQEDIIHFNIIIDESHRWVNPQKKQLLEQLIIYQREARKFFGGIILASQSIRDFVPDGTDQEGLNEIKTLFELTQYKFIFQQDSNTLPKINQIFQGAVTDSQISRIPYLTLGQCILCISGENNIEFTVHLSKQEERLFSGGM